MSVIEVMEELLRLAALLFIAEAAQTDVSSCSRKPIYSKAKRLSPV
ncbi:hypothetical protein [Paenibacillus sp. B-A-8]